MPIPIDAISKDLDKLEEDLVDVSSNIELSLVRIKYILQRLQVCRRSLEYLMKEANNDANKAVPLAHCPSQTKVYGGSIDPADMV